MGLFKTTGCSTLYPIGVPLTTSIVCLKTGCSCTIKEKRSNNFEFALRQPRIHATPHTTMVQYAVFTGSSDSLESRSSNDNPDPNENTQPIYFAPSKKLRVNDSAQPSLEGLASNRVNPEATEDQPLENLSSQEGDTSNIILRRSQRLPRPSARQKKPAKKYSEKDGVDRDPKLTVNGNIDEMIGTDGIFSMKNG